MRESTPCPNIGSYQSLVVSEMAADKESRLSQREKCDSRGVKSHTLSEQDTRSSCIRGGEALADSSNHMELVILIRRLIQLGFPACGASMLGGPRAAGEERSNRTRSFACDGYSKPQGVNEALAGKQVPCPHSRPAVPFPASAGEGESACKPTMTETAMFPSRQACGDRGHGGQSAPGFRPQGHTGPDLGAFLAPPQGPDELGRLGPYRVLEVLGAGGMGVVFRAEDPRLQRPVALKAMLPALAANESARQRFLREARAAASIKHDHIVSIYQVDEDGDAPLLAMEYLEGESLDDRIKRDSKLPLADVLLIGREIAEGLEAAHAKGLIHRDIKPGNVWLEKLPGERGTSARRFRVKILDFGLARTTGDDVQLTQSGTIVGTPAYMPPEQARGDKVDARCDLYSLGGVLFRMCTGQLPFKGDNTMSLLLALATEQPRSPREINADVPPALANLILRLLAKDPARRPASARDVAEALQDISLPKSSTETASRVPVPPWRRWTFLAAVAGAFLLAALLTVLVPRLRGPEEGTVALKTDDADVELVFKNGEREITVRDKKNGDEIRLPLGNYQVDLRAGKTGQAMLGQTTATRCRPDPREGDWFTRLCAKWLQDKSAAKQ